MIDLNRRYQLGSEGVVAKVMDGEAIIINLDTGVYYSMDKVGALAWSLLESGHDLTQCIDVVAVKCGAAPEQVSGDLQRLVQELVDENLLVHSSGDAALVVDNETEMVLPYETPILNIYRDMGDLLALDPPTPGLQLSPWGAPGAEEPSS